MPSGIFSVFELELFCYRSFLLHFFNASSPQTRQKANLGMVQEEKFFKWKELRGVEVQN